MEIQYVHVRMRSLDNICMGEGTFSEIHHRWAHEVFFQLKPNKQKNNNRIQLISLKAAWFRCIRTINNKQRKMSEKCIHKLYASVVQIMIIIILFTCSIVARSTEIWCHAFYFDCYHTTNVYTKIKMNCLKRKKKSNENENDGWVECRIPQ